jgi:hypothetical protein
MLACLCVKLILRRWDVVEEGNFPVASELYEIREISSQ